MGLDKNKKTQEHWVMVDLLDVYSQLGVDVFSRMKEFNKSRILGRLPFPIRES